MSEHFIQPDAAALLQNLAAQGGPKLSEMALSEARAAVRALTQHCDLPCADACVTREIPTCGRLYSPRPDTSGPVIVFVHGGGFVLGDLDTYDSFARYLSTRSGLRVLSADYRLAPEAPFPAALEDVNRIVAWVHSDPPQLGAPVPAVALAGDSAGAALCACSALTGIGALLLLYPVTDLMNRSESYQQFGRGYLLEAADMELFIRSYTPNERDRGDPRASPLHIEDLSGFPPTTVLTCALDVLRDEGRAFASRLVAAGVPTCYREARGLIHGVATLRGALPSARPVLEDVIDDLVRQLSSTAVP